MVSTNAPLLGLAGWTDCHRQLLTANVLVLTVLAGKEEGDDVGQGAWPTGQSQFLYHIKPRNFPSCGILREAILGSQPHNMSSAGQTF